MQPYYIFYIVSCMVMQLMQWAFKAIIQSTSLCDMVESLAYWSGQMIYCCIWINHPLHGGPPVQPYSGIPGCVVEWFLSSVYLNSNHRLYEQGCAEAKLPPPYPLSLSSASGFEGQL